jgi:hypothetical protein
VFVVNTHAAAEEQPATGAMLSPRDALDRCHTIIAAGGRIAVPEIVRFRARGGRYVLLLPDNPVLDMADQSIFDRGTRFGPVDCHDDVWVLDTFRAAVQVLQAIYRCPVWCLPLVWSPSYVDAHNRTHQHPDQQFAFRRPAQFAGPWRCVINAANTAAFNMGVLPLMAVNRAHIDNPGAVGRVEFRNGARLVEHLTFNHIAASLELHREGALTIWSDQDFHALLALKGDCVVSHRLDGLAEFAHLDTVYAGYPLLHNARDLADLGYFYPDNAIDRAVALAGEMFRAHATDAKLADARLGLGRFAVVHPDNRRAYARAIGS